MFLSTKLMLNSWKIQKKNSYETRNPNTFSFHKKNIPPFVIPYTIYYFHVICRSLFTLGQKNQKRKNTMSRCIFLIVWEQFIPDVSNYNSLYEFVEILFAQNLENTIYRQK